MCNISNQNKKSDLPFPLLGPPEIYTPVPAISDPFMGSMVSKYNKGPPPKPCMGFTENRSPTFLSSGNSCLDFFFHVVPNRRSKSVTSRLQLAWDQDPLTALKLVCNLRGIRGTGKGDKEGFYAAALWLHESHPRTLAHNTTSIAEFGYFKDLPEILYRLLEGLHAHKKKKGRVMKIFYKVKEELSNEEKRIAVGKRIVDKYNNDPVYRFLHDQISNTFTGRLKSDLLNLHKGNLRNISFAAKWCPSLYSFYDRYTLLCESIARRLFPRDHYPEYQGIEDAHYAYRVRDRLRKEVLVPLRKALKVPEVYMSAQEWGVLPYNRVPFIAMKNYKYTFMKRDKERFEEYLGSVKRGDRKIAAGALLPHQIIESVRKGGDGAKVAELQWQRIVEDLSEKGTLKNCLAICDLSATRIYSRTPPTLLDESVALGLLVSDLSEEPWKGKLITFSRNPQLQMIKGESLESKVSSIERMHSEWKTDFQRVFDKILEVAKEGKLSEEQMIKRLFVFSAMEFDEASLNPWETDYEAICRKFKESGYGSCVPEIVFWNLRDSRATPVPSHQKAVALVSGFSQNLLKEFLKEGGILNPESTMESAIAGDEYNKLVVVD
ncbi:uncharacterized protein LOC132278213 [Cornus florida]|uniref:uncharacterized protein LOC132278213 n=1 Tax=Cornus florida TaxID=4283 RepID=UPI002897AF3B|nr:uncharacterized protein LOC132278213 [Cornus florida]